jgi:hypothetical protein
MGQRQARAWLVKKFTGQAKILLKLPHKSRTENRQFLLPHSFRTPPKLPHKTTQEFLLKITQRCDYCIANTMSYVFHYG